MSSFLLDTNIIIALLNDTPSVVRGRFEKALDLGARLYISTIVEFELRYGVSKSQHREKNETKLKTLLRGPIDTLPFESNDAITAGEIRAALEKQGTPIGAYDVQIAGQAVNRNLTLVTANVREFSRVPGIAIADWTASER